MKQILRNQMKRLFRLYGRHQSRRLCRMIVAKDREIYAN